MPHFACAVDTRLGKECLSLGPIKARMHASDIIQKLPHSNPSRQHSHIRDKGSIAHEQIALCPRITPQNPQFTLEGSQAENCVQCGGLSRTVRSNDSQDAPFLHPQVETIECHRVPE